MAESAVGRREGVAACSPAPDSRLPRPHSVRLSGGLRPALPSAGASPSAHDATGHRPCHEASKSTSALVLILTAVRRGRRPGRGRRPRLAGRAGGRLPAGRGRPGGAGRRPRPRRRVPEAPSGVHARTTWMCWSGTADCSTGKRRRPPTGNASFPYTRRRWRGTPARNALRRAAVDLAMEQGEFGRARDHLELLAHYRPDDGELEDLLGQCEEALGDAEKAEAAYRAAVALAPDRVGAYGRLARLLRGALGRPSEADQVMDDLVAANDRASAAYLERAAYRDGRRLAGRRREGRGPRPGAGAGRRARAADDGRPRRPPRPRRRRPRRPAAGTARRTPTTWACAWPWRRWS